MITSSINTSKHAFKPNNFTKALTKFGGLIPDKIQDYCDLTKNGSMKRTPLYLMLLTLVVGSRYISARGPDERREVLTRDPITITTLIYAVPILKKVTGMFLNKKTGIPTSNADSYDQLAKWFSVKNIKAFDKKNIKNGFAGFCINIKRLGGDLLKCFDVLGKEKSKKTLNEIANLVGIKEKVTNKNIIGLIRKAQKSTDKNVKQKLDYLKVKFIGENKLLTKASHLKSITDFGCIASAIFILGGFLPWFNIQHTKKLYKNKKSENNSLNNEQPKILSTNNSKIINKFEKFQTTGQMN